MATMPRPKGKAKKIAYNILGIPANIKNSKNAVNKKVNKRLIYEEARYTK